MSWGLLLAFPVASFATGVFKPAAVDYANLTDAARGGDLAALFESALGLDGLLQVTGIPGFAALRQQALREAHACITKAPRAQELALADGTLRRTLAATARPLGREDIDHGSQAAACRAFERTSATFRDTVASVANAFVQRLSGVLDIDASRHILEREAGGTYDTLEEVVASGERLEHFHSYKVPAAASAAAGELSLDFHVDQGLFIAFVPALMVGDTKRGGAPGIALGSGAFLLKTPKGEEVEAELRPDSLVFLLGDGVNQYLNKAHAGMPLHAPSHAFRMPQDLAGFHRVWYGLMQLPPADAKSEDSKRTFGDIREEVLRASGSVEASAQAALALGCSRKLTARELMASCADSQMYCWHRCMDYTVEVSPTACAAKGLGFNCTDQFDQVYREVNGHGDYNLQCTNSTAFVTAPPSVDQPAHACAEWAAVRDDAAYGHRVSLDPLDPDTTFLLWNVVDGELEAKMIHNGRAGWLAVGLENVGGSHYGMNGAHIIQGLNFGAEDGGPSIGEYEIHEISTAWRTWKNSLLSPSALKDTEMVVASCYTSMAFKTSTFHGRALNMTTGINRMIWALSHAAYPTQDFGGYAPYHAAVDGNRDLRTQFRGHVHLDFVSNVEVPITTTVAPGSTTMADGTTTTADEEVSSRAASQALVMGAAAVGLLCHTVLSW